MNRSELELNGALLEVAICCGIRMEFPDIHLIPNLLIKNDTLLRRKETQIDVVAVSSSAIYVIEAKNWKCYIKGDPGDYQWTGMSSNLRVMNVFNPVLQNLYHVRLIKAHLIGNGVQMPPIYNLVCVPDQCEIRTQSKEVLPVSSIVPFINSVEFFSKKHYDKNLMVKMIRRLCDQ